MMMPGVHALMDLPVHQIENDYINRKAQDAVYMNCKPNLCSPLTHQLMLPVGQT